MTSFKDNLLSQFRILEGQLNFKAVTGRSLVEWFNPLLDSFTDDGAIAYLLNVNKRYRASPLSSTIEWLANADLLTLDGIDLLQKKLIFLRDNNQKDDADIGELTKFQGDELGWSLSEGVSVWSTSTALIALFDKYNNWKQYTSVIKESTIWLIKQRKTNGAWSYQLDDNCTENIIMTALAVRAICKLAINYSFFSLSRDEFTLISEALHNGFIFISKTVSTDKKYSYWNFSEQKNCVATTWAMLALKELMKVEGFSLKQEEIEVFYYHHLERSMNFVLSKIPKKSKRWNNEQLVLEGGAKYNKQKNYQSLSATLIPQLFELGVSPYHPKIINQIRWLIDNPTEWKIETYDRGNICAFSYAMILSTITIWINKVGSTNARTLIAQPVLKREKIQKIVFGQLSEKTNPYQMVLKSRIKLFFIAIIIFLFIFIFGSAIWNLSFYIVRYIISLFIASVNDIVVNLVASAIWSIGGIVLALILKK